MKLTNRSIKSAPGRSAGRRGPRGTRSDGSRERLFAAAAAEFAARGFAGANVDRIAAAARLNKAMIYYHFRSKAGLYREILRDMFAAVAFRVDAVAASPVSPEDKIRQFVEAIASEAEARRHFPAIWCRELAEGGAHLDDTVLKVIGSVVRRLGEIIEEGVQAGRFVRVSPLLVHGSIVAPVLMYFAAETIRRRLGRFGVPTVDRDAIVAHAQRLALGALEGRL